MSQSLATVAYLGAAILFILSLGGLSNPETSRRGNLYGIIGMALAVLATAFSPDGVQAPVAATQPIDVMRTVSQWNFVESLMSTSSFSGSKRTVKCEAPAPRSSVAVPLSGQLQLRPPSTALMLHPGRTSGYMGLSTVLAVTGNPLTGCTGNLM